MLETWEKRRQYGQLANSVLHNATLHDNNNGTQIIEAAL